MWSAPMHDPDWVKLTLSEVQRRKGELGGYEKVHGLLTAVSEVSGGCRSASAACYLDFYR